MDVRAAGEQGPEVEMGTEQAAGKREEETRPDSAVIRVVMHVEERPESRAEKGWESLCAKGDGVAATGRGLTVLATGVESRDGCENRWERPAATKLCVCPSCCESMVSDRWLG